MTDCPICGQRLGAVAFEKLPATNAAQDTLVGRHIHYPVGPTVIACSNAHRFEARGEIILTRVP